MNPNTNYIDNDRASKLLEKWSPVLDYTSNKVDAIEDPLDRQNRLAELNVREQLRRLSQLDIVRAALERGQDLTLHGWIYDLSNGRLTELFEVEPVSETSGFAMPLQDVPQMEDHLAVAE